MRGTKGGGGGGVPVAFNKQYNTPINMYSKQHVANAFEGQTGIALDPNHADGEPAYSQSQVYKLVQEQDNQHQRKTRQQKQPLHQTQSAPPAWARQQSEGDDFGVSEF